MAYTCTKNNSLMFIYCAARKGNYISNIFVNAYNIGPFVMVTTKLLLITASIIRTKRKVCGVYLTTSIVKQKSHCNNHYKFYKNALVNKFSRHVLLESILQGLCMYIS